MDIQDAKIICFYLPGLFGGGAEHVAVRIANALANEGHQVYLVLVQARGPYLSEVNNKVNIINLNCGDKFSTLKSLPKLVVYLKRNNPDVLFSTLFRSNIIAALALRLSRVKSRLIVRHPNMLYPQSSQTNSIFTRLIKKLAILAAKSADHVVLTSKAMKDEFFSLAQFDPSKIVVIPNPVPIDEIKYKSQMNPGHEWLINKVKPVVLSVGRLTYQKNFELLIKAFAIVNAKTPARLIILGEGEERLRLENLARELDLQDSVSLPGFTSNPYAFMAKVDVFVLPSLWEGFPNVLVEAIACGVPVIATDCPGGSVEILENGKWGDIVKNDDLNDLSLAIHRILAGRQSKNPGNRVANFSSEKITNKYLRLIVEA